MNMVILMDGTVGEVTITQGAGEPFDSVAVAALKSYRFEPARDTDGNALAVMVNFDMLFEEPPPPPVTRGLPASSARDPKASRRGRKLSHFAMIVFWPEAQVTPRGNVQLIFPAQPCTVSIVAAGHEKYEITYGLRSTYDEEEEGDSPSQCRRVERRDALSAAFS